MNNSENNSKTEETIENLQKSLMIFENEKTVLAKKRSLLQMQLKERKQKLEELEIRMDKLQTTLQVYQTFLAKELGPRENKALKTFSGASYMVPIRKEIMAHAVKQFKEIQPPKLNKYQ